MVNLALACTFTILRFSHVLAVSCSQSGHTCIWHRQVIMPQTDKFFSTHNLLWDFCHCSTWICSSPAGEPSSIPSAVKLGLPEASPAKCRSGLSGWWALAAESSHTREPRQEVAWAPSMGTGAQGSLPRDRGGCWLRAWRWPHLPAALASLLWAKSTCGLEGNERDLSHRNYLGYVTPCWKR